MPIVAKVELKATIDAASIGDTINVNVDSHVGAKEEAFSPGESRDFELYGGSKEGIELVFVKIEPDPKPTAPPPPPPSNGGPQPPVKYVEVGFALENVDTAKENWLKLTQSTLLLGEPAKRLMPAKLEKVQVKNGTSEKVKVSVLVGRKKVAPPPKAVAADGN